MDEEQYKAEMARLWRKPQAEWTEGDWEEFERANQAYADCLTLQSE